MSLPHVESIRLKIAPERPKTTDSIRTGPQSNLVDQKQRIPEVRSAWATQDETFSIKERFSPLRTGTVKERADKKSKKLSKTTNKTSTSVYDRLATSPFHPKKKHPSQSDRPRVLPGEKLEHDDETMWSAQGGRTLIAELPMSNGIPLSLRHVVDTFVRMVLPWQVSPLVSLCLVVSLVSYVGD